MMKKLCYPDDIDKINKIIEKNKNNLECNQEIENTVDNIIENVKSKGDKALYEYTFKFDNVKLEDLTVSEREKQKAYDKVNKAFLNSLNKAIEKISSFHKKQLKESWFSHSDGRNMVGQLINPIKRIGAYVPGGTAAYPSSVLMTVIPAKIAGVDEIVVTTPPNEEGLNPYTLVALEEIGVEEIYKVGGAQAVAALSYGTETINSVDKIVGPGNIYVTMAKKRVFGHVGIDMLAGPSEVLILADDSADPTKVAADLLSQAEHDPLAVPILITTSPKLAEKTAEQVESQLEELGRRDIAASSWEENGIIIVVDSLENGFNLVNRFAPEHFEMVVEEPLSYLGLIKNVGAVFVGEYSPEPLGDYMAGPNHVLPTGGTARFASPLSVDDFIKKSSLIYYDKEGLEKLKGDIERLANIEGLDAHASAIKKRFECDNND